MGETKGGEWTKTAPGGDRCRMEGKTRWRLRKITSVIDGGPAMWWLYRDSTRYTPTGRYDDAVMTRSRAAPTKWADAIIAKVQP